MSGSGWGGYILNDEEKKKKAPKCPLLPATPDQASMFYKKKALFFSAVPLSRTQELSREFPCFCITRNPGSLVVCVHQAADAQAQGVQLLVQQLCCFCRAEEGVPVLILLVFS